MHGSGFLPFHYYYRTSSSPRDHLVSPTRLFHCTLCIVQVQRSSLSKFKLLDLFIPRSVYRSCTPITHNQIPIPMLHQILPPCFILLFQSILTFILDKEEGDEYSNETTACGDDECESITQLHCDASGQSAMRGGRGEVWVCGIPLIGVNDCVPSAAPVFPRAALIP
jgi:hypothetical protein